MRLSSRLSLLLLSTLDSRRMFRLCRATTLVLTQRRRWVSGCVYLWNVGTKGTVRAFVCFDKILFKVVLKSRIPLIVFP